MFPLLGLFQRLLLHLPESFLQRTLTPLVAE